MSRRLSRRTRDALRTAVDVGVLHLDAVAPEERELIVRVLRAIERAEDAQEAIRVLEEGV